MWLISWRKNKQTKGSGSFSIQNQTKIELCSFLIEKPNNQLGSCLLPIEKQQKTDLI